MSAAPPVKDRPKCPGCGKPLTPSMALRRSYPEKDTRPPEWLGTYKAYGAFCTLRCCEAYANAMFKLHRTMFRVVDTPATT